MPKITFVPSTTGAVVVMATPGRSIMEAAVINDGPGILAECGGSCVCGTCQVYVDPAYLARLAAPNDEEQALLESLGETRRPNNRLSCQITVGDELDGVVLHVPVML